MEIYLCVSVLYRRNSCSCHLFDTIYQYAVKGKRQAKRSLFIPFIHSMAETVSEHENPVVPLPNTKSTDSNEDVSDKSQLSTKSTSIASGSIAPSKQANLPTYNPLFSDMSNAMPDLSVHDARSTNRSYPTRSRPSSYQSPSHQYSTSAIDSAETEAQLTAFTPSLMSVQVFPSEASQLYQRNDYHRPRSRMPYQSNTQPFQPVHRSLEKTASQPAYYVDSFTCNFSDKPSSNSKSRTKTKHVTFQEPEIINEQPKMNSIDMQYTSMPPNDFRYVPTDNLASTPMYHSPRSFDQYNHFDHYNPYNGYYPQYNNPMMMMNRRFINHPRQMTMMPTPVQWLPTLYYPQQHTPIVHRQLPPRQLYDPKKPKVSPVAESHDSTNILRNIVPKNKKKTKQTNSNENPVASTPEPPAHPITILRKPSVDAEVSTSPPSVLPTPAEDRPVSPPVEESSTISTTEVHSPFSTSDTQPVSQAESNTLLSFPSDELLSLLQSANCISSLNEYAQQKKIVLNYEFSIDSSSLFRCVLSLNSRSFPVSLPCSSKSEAQKLACDQALRILYRESSTDKQSSLELLNKHDCIAHRSVSTFQNLNVNELLLGRKTLACMLMVTDEQFDQARVISIGTGNSCLDETNLIYADDGTALHDCHAEILARRGLIRFLFEQIKQSKENQSSIFAYDSTHQKYELHDNITFHMYISSIPCGNASLNMSSNSIRYKQGQTEGTSLASTSSTKYPIKSCTDKICRWNILGIQGGLLINVLSKPIYLQTITLACDTTFDRDRVKYSLCERLNQSMESLPSPYRTHTPDIDCPKNRSLQKERQVAKLQTNAFAWNVTQYDRTELLEPMTGRLKNDRSMSSLSKQQIFNQFTSLLPNTQLLAYKTYQQAKQLDTTYVTVKRLIAQAFQTSSADETNTSWLSKSDQLEQFPIE